MAASSSPQRGGPGSAPDTNKAKRDRQAKLRTPSDRQVWSQLDDLQRQAYDDGRQGAAPPPPEAHDAVHQAYNAGVSDRADDEGDQAMGRMAAQAKAATKPKTDSKVPGQAPIKLSVQDQGAQFILGMVAYCLVINYVRYGWPGVTGWFSAKFTNTVTLGTGAPNGAKDTTPPGGYQHIPGPAYSQLTPQQQNAINAYIGGKPGT